MNEVALANYLREIKEKRNIHGKANIDFYTNALDISEQELVHLLLFVVVNSDAKYARLKDLYTASEIERQRLDKIVNEQFASKSKMQAVKVRNGMPIARKSSKYSEMKLRMKLGSTDEELMEWLNISKTTLWRYKKKLQEESNDSQL